MEKIRVSIADDHQLILDGLRNIIEKQDAFSFIFEASNGREVVERMQQFPVDVLLIDLDMPEMNGFETIEVLKQTHPNTRIIVLSVHEESHIIKKSIQYGCDGYIFKRSEPSDIINAIQQVNSGKKFFSTEVTLAMASNQSTINPQQNPNHFNKIQQLSNREQEVLKLIVDGLSSSVIAEQLHLSKRTIDAHRNNILRKLDVKNTVELVKFVILSGMV